jgi:hypothetical protein
MLQLTPEQIVYKERTLAQLRKNQAALEGQLDRETRPEVVRSIEEQLNDIEAHVNRLEDELAGNVLFHEPVADELFKQAVKALAHEKFHLAKKHILRLETIEPFHPALGRLREEAESERVSRRTRSIAQGTATVYPGMSLPVAGPASPLAPGVPAVATPGQPAAASDPVEAGRPWYAHLLQFHIIVSCLVLVLIGCVMLGMFGVTILQWLIESP